MNGKLRPFNPVALFLPGMMRCMFFILCLLLVVSGTLFAAAKSWSPVTVDAWDPPFNNTFQRSRETYNALEKAGKKWRIQVFIPHLKDAYWLGVNFGLIDQARRLGVNVTIQQAGGYNQLDVQRKQILDTLSRNSDKLDGVIISGISETGLNDVVKRLSDKGIPVLDLINGLSSPDIAARVAVSYRDTGYLAGSYLRSLQEASGKTVSVAWFPGPEGAGWVSAGDSGFKEAIKGSGVQILTSAKGDTGSAVQKKLVKSALDRYPGQLDFIVGTTVTAEVAVAIVRKMGLLKKIGILSYYYSPGVHRGIRRGYILAAPSDHQVLQARIAIDTMVRIIEGKQYYKHVAPVVSVVDKQTIRKWDSSSTLAPRGFRPIFSIND